MREPWSSGFSRNRIAHLYLGPQVSVTGRN